MLATLKKLWKEESGQGMTEYGLILALIVIGVIAVLGFIGDELYAKFDEVRGGLAGEE